MQSSDFIYTLEEYWRMVETFPGHKYEYANGDIRMMTGGSPAHAQIEANIARVVGNALYESECNVYGSDAILKLSSERCYVPDLSVSCDPADWTRPKALEAPTLVVEILSPSTERIDKTEKLDAYKQYPTVQEILLVDSRQCSIDHYHRMNSMKWEVFSYKDREGVLELAALDIVLVVKDVYHKVYLELEE